MHHGMRFGLGVTAWLKLLRQADTLVVVVGLIESSKLSSGPVR